MLSSISDSGLQPEFQIAIVDQLSEALLLEQAVDERHVGRKVIVQDDAAHRGIDVGLDVFGRLGVHHVLAVERLGQIDDLTGVAQLDRRERFHFAHFERDENVVDRRELLAFALVSGRALVR